jgi:DNA-binding response OmpR family regulator
MTAKGDDMDKILGFEYGADDYLTKPFNILELKARVKALFRRSVSKAPEKDKDKYITIKNMVINVSNRGAVIDGIDAELTAKEFDLLYLFATNPGKVFSRESLLEAIWKYDYMGDLRTVDVHIRRLREKIEKNPSQPEFVYTKWGVGYYLTDK